MMIATLLTLALAAPALAAPPKEDYVYPAGGQRGQKVEVAVGGTLEPWPSLAWCSHPGIEATPTKKPGQYAIAIAADVPCGIHWLRFHNKDGASGLRPFLVNQIPELIESEPNDEPKKAQEVTASTVVVNGRLDKPNDTDVFTVKLKKGQTLVASVEAFRTLRSPMDAVLQILSADGFVLAQNDDFKESDPFLAFDVPRDGEYRVRVFCFPAVADSRVGLFGKETCVYRLTLTTGSFIDHAWPLAVEKANPGSVDLIGWNISAGKRRVEVVPVENSEHIYLQPEGFANGTLVRVEPHRTRVLDSEITSLPVTLMGRIKDPTGVKVHLNLKKGGTVSLRIDARELDFPLDPVLVLFDPAGKQLQRIQAAKLNVDPSLDFTAAQDGNYSLHIRDLHEEGGPRYVFRLRAVLARPDFDAVLPTDRFSAASGKPLEIPITLTRKNGLTDGIDFTAEGLGPAVRVEFVPSKDAKQNKLLVHGIKEGNTPFRLFAQVKGRVETRRVVLASLPDLNALVSHLWIAPPQ